MQHYCEQVRDDEYGDHPTEACEAVIRAVQQELAALEPGPIEHALAFELVTAEQWALHALLDSKSPSEAKREHIRLSEGRPLAICRGSDYGHVVTTALGSAVAHAQGCLRIFEAPTRTNGRVWSYFCPECRPRNGKRQPLRDAERALQRRHAEIARMRHLPITS